MATKTKTGSKTKSSASKKATPKKKSAPKTTAKASKSVKKSPQKPKAKTNVKKTAQKPKTKTIAKKSPQKPKVAKKSTPKKPVSAAKKTKPRTPAKPKASTTVKTQKKTPVVKEEIKVTQTSKAFEEKFDEFAATTALTRQEKKSTGFGKLILAIIVIIIIVLIYLFYPREKTVITKKEVKPQVSTEESVKTVEPAKKEVVPETETPASEPEGNVYTVKYKDQLTEISKKIYGNHADWKKIYRANKDKIDDPNLIFPGQKLKIPE